MDITELCYSRER